MAHYSTLQDYRFDADIDDIRGARLYGDGGAELAKIKDVVFEHGTGNIEYLVADEGHDRCVLVPVTEVRTAITSDRDFDSELTRADMERLPAFQSRMLKHDKEWHDFLELHRNAWRDRENAALREYKEEWVDDPVEHRKDDVAHTITPIEGPAENVRSIDGGRGIEDDYVPDLTPQRLAPIFTKTENTSDKLNMVPQAEQSRGPAAEYATAGLGSKWNGYQEMLRRELPRLRGACQTCAAEDKRVA